MTKSLKTYIAISILSFVVYSCQKNEREEGDPVNTFLTENINILLDSLSTFHADRHNKISVQLLDSINDNVRLIKGKKYKYSNVLMNENILSKIESDYNVELVKRENFTAEFIFVRISNLYIDEEGNEARVTVKKRRGIGMVKNMYVFKRINNLWILKNKKLVGMG